MDRIGTDLGVMLGRILERSETTVTKLGNIEDRMDSADLWRSKASEQLSGLHHRMNTLERPRREKSPSKKDTPPVETRSIRIVKNTLAGAAPPILLWLTNLPEHLIDLAKLVNEFMKLRGYH